MSSSTRPSSNSQQAKQDAAVAAVAAARTSGRYHVIANIITALLGLLGGIVLMAVKPWFSSDVPPAGPLARTDGSVAATKGGPKASSQVLFVGSSTVANYLKHRGLDESGSFFLQAPTESGLRLLVESNQFSREPDIQLLAMAAETVDESRLSGNYYKNDTFFAAEIAWDELWAIVRGLEWDPNHQVGRGSANKFERLAGLIEECENQGASECTVMVGGSGSATQHLFAKGMRPYWKGRNAKRDWPPSPTVDDHYLLLDFSPHGPRTDRVIAIGSRWLMNDLQDKDRQYVVDMEEPRPLFLYGRLDLNCPEGMACALATPVCSILRRLAKDAPATAHWRSFADPVEPCRVRRREGEHLIHL